jgi:hypothetical protein
MSRSHTVVAIVVVILASIPALAASPGTPSIGWLTIVGSEQAIYTDSGPVYDTGYIQVYLAGGTVIYNYSQNDTPESIAAGIAALLNSSGSFATASATGYVVTITSKATGSSANSSLYAIYGTYDPGDFYPSFQTGTYGMIGGRDGPRNFRMAMYFDGDSTNADLTFVGIPFGVTNAQQAPGHSILAMGVQSWFPPGFAQQWADAVIIQNHFDLTRVDAVNVDEPYAQLMGYLYNLGVIPSPSLDGDPCAAGDFRRSFILQGYAQLQAAAAAIKQTSPRTRFWVNFSQPEVGWMRNGSCAFLNAPYIDVVSLDQYLADFVTTVKANYDWFAAHPGYSGQQVALVPGTFVHSSGLGTDPVAQAKVVEEYFDYATSMNQSCTLPLGSTGVTGEFDGCPVWLVSGFLYEDCPACPDYIGLADPATAPIQAAWLAELLTPLVDPRRPAVQSFARTNNGNSIYYIGEDGNVWQSWSSSSSSVASSWHTPSITTIAAAPLAVAGSASLAYTDSTSNNQDVYYMGTDQHAHLLWWNGDPWKTIDLTGTTGGPSLKAGTQFVRTNGGNSFYYLGADGNIWQFWNNASSSTTSGWRTANISAIVGTQCSTTNPSSVCMAAGSSFLAYTETVSNNQDVYYVGSDEHVHLLWWNGDPWHTLDLTATTGGPNVQAGTQLVRTNNGNSFYYVGTDGNVWQFWNNSSGSTASGWHTANINAIAGVSCQVNNNIVSGCVAAGSSLLAYTDPVSNNQVVYYVGADQHVHLLWWNGDPWHTIDLTATAGGANASALAPMAVTYNNGFFYLGTDGNIWQLWTTGSTSTPSAWHAPNISAIAGSPAANPGTPMLGYVDPTTNGQAVYYIGSDQHVHLLWWTSDPWHTIDLTATTGGPNVQ